MSLFLFLETATELSRENMILGYPGLGALIMTFLAVGLIGFVLLWVYTSFAFVAIAKKANYPKPNLAWIPYVGPLIVTSQIAEMHWWPILLLLLWGIPFVNFFSSIALIVFAIIWLWKTFEVIGKPNWWAILLLIPLVNLIILGIAAWSKPEVGFNKKLVLKKKLVKIPKKV